MDRRYSFETRQMVLGENIPEMSGRIRTPLNVEFGNQFGFVEPEILHGFDNSVVPSIFNAVGSRVYNGQNHLPIIDADFGAEVDAGRQGRKVVLNARGGSYTSSSSLRDVLGDNQIELEVFTRQGLKSTTEMGVVSHRMEITGPHVGAIVMRSAREGTFASVRSTTPNHAHLYIQQSFSDSDNAALIDELEKVGAISENWANLTRESGMGILRTPWTSKLESHFSSDGRSIPADTL